MRRLPLLLLTCLAACRSVPVSVGAAAEEDGVRVLFRRAPYADREDDDRLARLDADGGTLEQVTHAPDRASVSALWKNGSGALRCRFPKGGDAEYRDGVPAAGTVRLEYVFFDDAGASITTVVARACPLLPALRLRVDLASAWLPATLRLPGRSVKLERAVSHVRLELPRDRNGRLSSGVVELGVRGASGEARTIVVAVDSDGVCSAVSGFLRNWKAGVD